MLRNVIHAVLQQLHYRRMRAYKRAGLQISDSCRIMGMPNFGSEPYLISIGENVLLTSRVTFITHDGGTHVFRSKPEFADVIKFGRITIHDNSVIGYGATILPGVSIGPNAVIAAGSIVTKDIPADCVAGGNPAKAICSVDEYAARSKLQCPPYDRRRYEKDMKSELLRLFPYPW